LHVTDALPCLSADATGYFVVHATASY
jgi:hypothetical protein